MECGVWAPKPPNFPLDPAVPAFTLAPMLPEVRALLILQDRDRRLLNLSKDLEKLPSDETRAKSKLAADEAAVAKAHEALVAMDIKVKKIDMETETRKKSTESRFAFGAFALFSFPRPAAEALPLPVASRRRRPSS